MSDPRVPNDPNSENVVAFRRKSNGSKAPPPIESTPEEERARVRSNVAALILAAILVAAGWLLVQKLGDASRTQDCLMSGRRNCAPVGPAE